MRTRKLFSIKNELIEKSREAMLSAVQIFNNPKINFKSETFIVLSIISRTYLLHAFYRENKVEYRYNTLHGSRKRFDKTKKGAYKYWELERCLDDTKSPIDNITKLNLKFLIGLRHEIEHQMTTKIDDLLSARFQACCLNYNKYLKDFFGDEYGIEKYLSFSLQFASVSESQIDMLSDAHDLPKHIQSYISDYDDAINDTDFNDVKYSYRALVFQKQVNRKGQADKVIEFIDPSSDIAKNVGKEYRVTKEKEKTKYIPGTIISILKLEGFNDFGIGKHTKIRKKFDAKNPTKGFGIQVEKQWYWYESRLNFLRENLREELREGLRKNNN